MKVIKHIFTSILCTCLLGASAFAAADDCSNSVYRNLYPDKCSDYETGHGFTTAAMVGGGVLAGAGLALVALAGSGGGSDTQSGTPARQPTLQIYDHVGYTDPVALADVMNTRDYQRNANHYNEIRLAYSLARGFTGAGSTIAVMDTGSVGWHGTAVESIAGGTIAPDATVNSYQIVNDNGDFLSYKEIGNIISSIDDANIFNNSWGIKTLGNYSAYGIQTRAQLERITDKTFIQSIVNQAVQNDAIFVWAAGNDGTSESTALAAMPRVIAEMQGHFINVVAWDSATGALADYSNQCGVTQMYCITAPGTKIDVGIGSASGTSFAAPIVSDAVAVIRQAFPYMSANEVTQLLFTTARDLGDAGIDPVYGWGMLDLERATRPVGAPLVPLAEGMQPLQQARASGVIGHKLRRANLDFAFYDAFGRAFNAKLNDNITFTENGRAYERLRSDDPIVAVQMGHFEFGFTNENLLRADGFIQTDDNALTSFIGMANRFEIGDVTIFQNARMGFSAPDADKNSMITGFSGMYTASAKLGAKYRDWTISVAMPETIIVGEMNLNLPIGRSNDGRYLYAGHTIDLAERPAIEYSVGYKYFSASYIDNPYGIDEFFVMAKHKLVF